MIKQIGEPSLNTFYKISVEITSVVNNLDNSVNIIRPYFGNISFSPQEGNIAINLTLCALICASISYITGVLMGVLFDPIEKIAVGSIKDIIKSHFKLFVMNPYVVRDFNFVGKALLVTFTGIACILQPFVLSSLMKENFKLFLMPNVSIKIKGYISEESMKKFLNGTSNAL